MGIERGKNRGKKTPVNFQRWGLGIEGAQIWLGKVSEIQAMGGH
jgi:hypothetical protein